MIDIQKLKQAALAATPGEWKTMRRGDEDCLDVDVFKSGGWNDYVTLAMGIGNENAIHIATANPSAVLELIARLEAAESNQVLSASVSQFKQMEDQLTVARENLMDILRKNDSLNEKLEAAESTLQLATTMYTQAISTLEAAEQDAARYRWFANDCDGNGQDGVTRWLARTVAPKELIDATFDLAMKESK